MLGNTQSAEVHAHKAGIASGNLLLLHLTLEDTLQVSHGTLLLYGWIHRNNSKNIYRHTDGCRQDTCTQTAADHSDSCLPELCSVCSTALHDITHGTEQAAVVIVYFAPYNTAAVLECD